MADTAGTHGDVHSLPGARRKIPTILIVHTLEFTNAARMALAFRTADCQVHGLCRRAHPLHRLSLAERIYTYHPFARIRSLHEAITAADPDLIIPCDDPAVMLMHRLHHSQKGSAGSAVRVRAVIERSLGRPDGYPLTTARSKLPVIAAAAGVRLPRTGCVSTLTELKEWLGREGVPAVLKADHTWGGWGVIVVRTLREAERAFRKMTGPRNLARMIKRLAWDQDPELFLQLMRGVKPALSVQAFIRGKLANCAVACWQGEVIASIAVEVLAVQGPTGNATVVRVVDNEEMVEAARRVIRRLNGSGFFGFDFVLEETSGRPFLIEINPRATQTNHLALGMGHDLPAALRARISDEPIRLSRVVADRDVIAFFPQELRRNPLSRFLLTAYHDIPYDEPALVQSLLAAPGPMRRLIAQMRTIRARVRRPMSNDCMNLPSVPSHDD